MTPFNLALMYIEAIGTEELTEKQRNILAKRHLRPAKEIIEFFENEPDMPSEIIDMAKRYFSEIDRNWTLETVLKNLPMLMSRVYKERNREKPKHESPYDTEGKLKVENIVSKIIKNA